MKSPQKVIQTKLLLLKKCTTLSYSGVINEYAKNMNVNASEMIVANGSKKEIDINELHTLMFLNSLIDHFQASITLLSDEEKQSIDKGARIPQENEITLTPPSADHAFTVNVPNKGKLEANPCKFGEKCKFKHTTCPFCNPQIKSQ